MNKGYGASLAPKSSSSPIVFHRASGCRSRHAGMAWFLSPLPLAPDATRRVHPGFL